MATCQFCNGPDSLTLGRFRVCRACVRGLIRGERPLSMPRSAFKAMRSELTRAKQRNGIRLSFGKEHRISERW